MFTDEDGYELWLKYRALPDEGGESGRQPDQLLLAGSSPTLAAAGAELETGLAGLWGRKIVCRDTLASPCAVVAGTAAELHARLGLDLQASLAAAGEEGYLLARTRLADRELTVVTGRRDTGVLYGAFALLRLLQTGPCPENLHLVDSPRIGLRLLNHWDNPDGTVERGYAGFSLWDWHKLPAYLEPRYRDYARANASVGINGVVVNNVNAHPCFLTPAWLAKVQALASLFRVYGIRVYLAVRYSCPAELGGLASSDPLDRHVYKWWQAKTDEIYRLIPDFGGFLVKANSEGQPGPQDYGRTHADGANLLARCLEPYGGVVCWRAFVYNHEVQEDRAKQAYNEFTPLDGRFLPNVLLQVKNGPVDFQPREPFHPLFGAMPKTGLLPEFQLTQEYLGCATHLVYLAPLIKECLDADTYAAGAGSTVARIADGSLPGASYRITGIAAVANTGTDRNWCGHPFAQANWYAFGRLAWDHTLPSAAIADEWLRMTFSCDPAFIEPVKAFMLTSRETAVNYMTPLGLHHIMAHNHHYGPGPWVSEAGRPDWTSVYYHKAEPGGLGFDRTATGSNGVSQYHEPLCRLFGDIRTCPEEFLLWFHHAAWDYKLAPGRTLWDELCLRYQEGVAGVRRMQRTWEKLAHLVDRARHEHVAALLAIQEQEARWWRDGCLLYFQSFSGRPFPAGCEEPAGTLEEYRQRRDFFVPGIINPY